MLRFTKTFVTMSVLFCSGILFHLVTFNGAFFWTIIEISVTKSVAPDPTATILFSGIITRNLPVILFFFFCATLKPVVFPLPTFLVFVHSIAVFYQNIKKKFMTSIM